MTPKPFFNFVNNLNLEISGQILSLARVVIREALIEIYKENPSKYNPENRGIFARVNMKGRISNPNKYKNFVSRDKVVKEVFNQKLYCETFPYIDMEDYEKKLDGFFHLYLDEEESSLGVVKETLKEITDHFNERIDIFAKHFPGPSVNPEAIIDEEWAFFLHFGEVRER